MKKRKFFSNSGILKWKMPLLISILFWMSLSGTAEAEVQLRSISLRLENVSLSEALSRIEEASGYSFFYDENKIDLSRQVSVNAQNKAVKDILKNILFSTGMTFEISNNQIVLVPEKKAAAKEVSVAVVQQQTHIVKGIVVDNLGEPVPGANVVEKGTTNGIITDMDGAFSLTVAPDAVLEISYIGYVTQSVSVKGKSTLNITLREDSQALEEVVVTGFGLSQKKATLTGAVTAVGSEDISRSVASTASGALVGKIAGLNTRQTDGRPGATTSIQIRNMGDPLYVIDGVQSDAGQFNNIDFNDIESISVLKDASAAIYGVRAANGVVVVNTKKGKRNTKNTVSLNAYYGWQNPSTFPKPADAATYITNYIQSETVQGKTDYTYSKEDYQKWLAGKEKGYVTTMFGRRRPIPELKSGNFMQRSFGERVAMNSPIQGTAADIIKIAMNRVYKRIQQEGLKSRLVLQVHDELLIETKKDELEIVSRILEEEMKGAAKLSVELEVDMHEGGNWYEAK